MASHSNDEMFKLLIEQQREAATKAVQEAAAKAAKAGQRYKDRDTNNAGENLISSISKMSCAGDAAAGDKHCASMDVHCVFDELDLDT